jgi:hypothetical protein
VQQALVPPAVLSLLVYTIGIPLAFLIVLVRHGAAIRHDQVMRAAAQGGSEASNPYYFVRQRYQELYRYTLAAMSRLSHLPHMLDPVWWTLWWALGCL